MPDWVVSFLPIIPSIFVLIFWLLIIFERFYLRERRRRRQRAGAGPRRPELPPVEPTPRPRERPPIVVEELALLIREPVDDHRSLTDRKRRRRARTTAFRDSIGLRVHPQAEWVVPVARLEVRRKQFAGRVLPVCFQIRNPNGDVAYEYALNHTLARGTNLLFPRNYTFPIRTRRDAQEGSEWALEIRSHGRIIATTPFFVRSDVVGRLVNRPLTDADGELSYEAERTARDISAPDLEDLIDEER